MKSVLTLIMLICLTIDIWLVIFTITRPDRRRTSCLSALCAVLLVYTLGHLIELQATTENEAFLALVVENFAIPNIPGLILLSSISLFAPLQYNKKYIYYSFIYGLFFYIIVFTNPLHHLYYTSITMVERGTEVFLRLGRGKLYYLNQFITFACLAAAYWPFISRLFRGTKKLRRQMALFIIGSAITLGADILTVFGFFPPGLAPAPIALTVSLILFSISFTRDDLMDVVIKARNTAIDTMDKAFVVLDNDSDFLYCNQSATKLFPELKGFEGSEHISSLTLWPEDLKNLSRNLQTSFTLTDGETERSYRADVEKLYRTGRRSIGFSVIISDITEETRLIDSLETMATTDPLTCILNRRKLFEMVERELEIAQRLERTTALLMFDVDHFKHINDAYGHNVGDEVLRTIANAIQSRLRVYDFFGRVGGEEFVIFTQSSGPEGLLNFANRLRLLIAEKGVEVNGKTVRVTASFGICEIPPGADLNESLANADQAMYRAKKEGRNRTVIYSEAPEEQ